MKIFNIKALLSSLFGLALIATLPAQAAPAAFTEGNRRMVEACVDPQIAGQTALRKKDNEPKTHTLTFQFSADYRTASVIAGTRVAKTADCSAIFNLANGRITGEVNIDGVIHDYTLQFTSGLNFSVTAFPLPMVAEGEQTSLWRVTNGDNEVFVGGVVNISQSAFWGLAFGLESDILRPSDFPLPAGFEEAYENADQLLTRAVPSQVQAQAITLQGLTLNLQTSLENDIGQDLFDQLNAFLTPLIGQGIQGLPFRAHWWADLVGLFLANGNGFVSGVDTYFQQKAMQDNKIIFGLEEADDQMFAINLNKLNEDRAAIVSAALEQTTNENLATELNALLDAWRVGNDDYLHEVLTRPDEEAELSDYTRKYTDRYAIWMNVFDDMLVSAPVEFVLMDVRYLVGINSFLVALQDAGYTVERY